MKDFIRLGNELLTINYSELVNLVNNPDTSDYDIITIDTINHSLYQYDIEKADMEIRLKDLITAPEYKDADPVKAYWRGVWEDSAKNRPKDRWAQKAGQAAKALSKRRKANKAARKARRHV